MKTLTTILALILSLSLQAQITGTWTLTKSFDTYNMQWVTLPERTLTITQHTPDTLKYTVDINGTLYRGTTSITGSNSLYWLKTDFVWNVTHKTRCFLWADSMYTHLQLYDTYIHYWKRIWDKYTPPIENKLTGINEPVISANIYPNPATDWINIPFDFQLSSITCQFIMSGQAGRVDISGLKSGIYFAKSLDGNALIVKFVKQ